MQFVWFIVPQGIGTHDSVVYALSGSYIYNYNKTKTKLKLKTNVPTSATKQKQS